MTVSYTGDVANGSSFGCFWKILGRWKGSVYKLIWRELIAYLCLYFCINVTYRKGMTEEQRETFEKVKVYCSKQIESIPMSFVLGFYVTLIVKRWWDQYWILPMPDSLALYISASIHGQNERGRLLRRTIMRYTMLAYIITLQRISFRVKKRFPTLQHLVDTGLMMESEKKIFDTMEAKTKVSKFWMPIVWASNLVNLARQEGRIHSDHMVQTIVTELSDFRRKLGRVMVYDNVSVPLVYTQVVTLAVYTYFVAALIGRQWVVPKDGGAKIYPGYELDLYFPIFLSLQFIFYIGWLKVAETLINPFGEDDDDFELNWLIDRHIKVSYMVVDEMHEEHPELLKDYYWEQKVPKSLPYNMASEQFRRNEPQGSTASMKIKLDESVYDNLPNVKRHSVIQDEVYAEYECVTDSPLADSRKNWLQRQMSRVESFRSTSSSSSLFRNRLQANGQIPSGYPQGAAGHHRLSLYDRLMNRRSSKDKTAPRVPPGGIGKPLNGSLGVGKDGMSSLMPQPHSRPRVPTPDVAKENQLNLMTAAPSDKPGRAQYNAPYNSNGSPNGAITNPQYSGPFPPNSPSQRNESVPTISKTPASPPGKSTSARPNVGNKGDGNTSPTGGSSSKSSKNTSPPPPPYDESASHPILTPIAENDGSPYSTSSTTRSSRSSNYPTTTSIFGRKPSPPPPQEDLPQLPAVTGTPSHNHSAHSNKSDWGSGHGNGNKQNKFHVSRHDDNFLEDLTAAAVIHELENALSQENSIDEEPYMTIAEINESKDDYNKMNHLSTVGPTPPPHYRFSYNAQQTTPSIHNYPSSLPLPPTPDECQVEKLDSERSLPPLITSVSNSSSLVSDRSRKISLGMTRQNAVVTNSLDDEGQSGSGSGSFNHIPTKQPNSHTAYEANDNDDGYDERGSYNEDDFIHANEITVSASDLEAHNLRRSTKNDNSDEFDSSAQLFMLGDNATNDHVNSRISYNKDSNCADNSDPCNSESSSSIGSYNENGSISVSPRDCSKNPDNNISSTGPQLATPTVGNISKDCEVFV